MTPSWARSAAWSRPAFSAGMLLLALLIVLHWKIGPILFRVEVPGIVSRGHGVHLGDPLAVLPALLAVPRRRLRLDRRLGVKAPVVPSPGRRAGDRA